jgi:hypothetical protein
MPEGTENQDTFTELCGDRVCILAVQVGW